MQMNRSMKKITLLFVAWAFVLGIAIGPQPARSIDLGGAIGDLVKVFGIAWVVNHFDKQIDRGINTFLQQHEAAIEQQTKVVPIIRVGTKTSTAVGAAQVMGPPAQVRKVQAVAELQLDIGSLRGRALIPVSTKDVKMGAFKGVSGVGVSANIKFPI